jgi:hypothetical protein
LQIAACIGSTGQTKAEIFGKQYEIGFIGTQSANISQNFATKGIKVLKYFGLPLHYTYSNVRLHWMYFYAKKPKPSKIKARFI